MHLIGKVAIYAGAIALLAACFCNALLADDAWRRFPFLIWLAGGGVAAIVLGGLFV